MQLLECKCVRTWGMLNIGNHISSAKGFLAMGKEIVSLVMRLHFLLEILGVARQRL